VLFYVNHPDHNVCATSKLVRLVMSIETPLIVINVHLFDHLEGLVPQAASDDKMHDAI
jgi:hypothetical protein